MKKLVLLFLLFAFPAFAAAANYAIIDQNGNVINVIMWDGISSIALPIGQSLITATAAGTTAQIGGRFVNGIFSSPPAPPVDPVVALTTLLVQQGVLQASDVNTAMTGTPQAAAVSSSLSAIATTPASVPLNTASPAQ
jgi:hypothetical protein